MQWYSYDFAQNCPPPNLYLTERVKKINLTIDVQHIFYYQYNISYGNS